MNAYRNPSIRRAAATAVAALLVLGGVACSSSSDTSDTGATGATTTSVSPEDVLVPGSEVVEGLADAKRMAADVQSTFEADPSKAEAKVAALSDRWFQFEGTIRKVDQDRYLDMEDALGAIKIGVDKADAERIRTGVADFTRLADAYLADHPDGGSVEAEAPTDKGTIVDLTLSEWKVDASTHEVPAGTTTFVSKNVGAVTHEIVLFRTDLDPAKLPMDSDHAVDEKGPGVTLVDEVEDIEPGETASFTVKDLPAGKYVLVCNLVEGNEKHYMDGMYTAFTVK